MTTGHVHESYIAHMRRTPIIAIIGSGSEIEPAVSNARELGRSIAENGWVLITGGRTPV
jgi:predicted Rossmann-fold nucleotide-binding protein